MDITSQRLLLGASAGGDSYWQLTHGQLAGGVYWLYDNESHVVSDANQNAYWSVNLYYSSFSQTRNGLFKVSKDGDLEFKVRTNSSTTGSSVDTWSMAVSDADGALYSLGNHRAFQNALAKTDLNYTDLATHSEASKYSNGRVILTSTGAPIVCSPNNTDLYISRLSSSLTAISSFRLAYTNRYFRYPCQVALLSDGSILCLASFNIGNTTSNQLALTLLNSTASSVTWTRYINAGNGEYNGMAVDSSNNIYILYSQAPFSGDLRLVKYNSSGVLQWAKQWSIGWATLPYYAIWHDNQFIVCGSTAKYIGNNAYRNGFVASFDSDGNKLWDNYSSVGSGFGNSYSICPAGPKAIYFVDGSTGGVVLYKVPTDGGATNAPGSSYRFGGAMPATTTTTISEQSWTWTTAQASTLSPTTQTPDAFNTVTANPTLTPIE